MGPKPDTRQKNSQRTTPDDEEEVDLREMMNMIKGMSVQLNGVSVKMEKMDKIESEVTGLKTLLNDLKNENKQLKTEAKETDKKLREMNEHNIMLENRLNHLEQHHRSWSARILNIPLSPEEESNNFKVRDAVYKLALLPILEGAVERKLLPGIPSPEQLLETAHVLPGKAGQPKPVILRFHDRNVREVIFRVKKYYAPRMETGTSGGGARGAVGGVSGGGRGSSGGDEEEDEGGFEGRGKYLYPLYEDLIRAAFLKRRALASDSRVKACWSVKGQLRFVLHSAPKDVKKVMSLLDSIETILK